jgi:hypothetical protein
LNGQGKGLDSPEANKRNEKEFMILNAWIFPIIIQLHNPSLSNGMTVLVQIAFPKRVEEALPLSTHGSKISIQ